MNTKGDVIKYFSFEYVPVEEKTRWKEILNRVIDSNTYIGGDEVLMFEREWATKVGARFAIGLSNGLDALTISLMSLKLINGKRVAVPAHTFIACWTAIIRVGAIPVPIDCDSEGLLDLEELELRNQEYDAVMPVHMHGACVDMERVMMIARKYNKVVIEDASQAHLARSRERFAGTYGSIGVFSLYPTKNLGALGDAAIIVTNAVELYDEIRSIRSYGADPNHKYKYDRIGFNMRLDSIQAALLRHRLEMLEQENSKRLELAKLYRDGLDNEAIKPMQQYSVDRVFHHYCVLTPYRENLQRYLDANGIQTEIHYPKLPSLELNRIQGSDYGFTPKSFEISVQVLSLPLSPWHTRQQIERVISTVNSFKP